MEGTRPLHPLTTTEISWRFDLGEGVEGLEWEIGGCTDDPFYRSAFVTLLLFFVSRSLLWHVSAATDSGSK